MQKVRLSSSYRPSLILATMVLGMLISACSIDSYSGRGSQIDDRISMPVNVYVGKPDTMQTKGYGPIDADKTDCLAGKNVYVYAFLKSDNTDFSVTSLQNSTSCLVDGSLDDESTVGGKQAVLSDIYSCAEWTGWHTPTYPTGDLVGAPYDFFAYYIDSLKLDNSQIHRSADDVTVDVTFDGRMDIMTAHSQYSGEKTDTFPAYSYMTARNGIFPIFSFKHKLVKLNFVAVPGNLEGGFERDVTVQSISVLSAEKAQLTVAYKEGEDYNDIVFDETSKTMFELSEADGSKMRRDKYTLHIPSAESTPLTIGGSLLVAPSKSYQLRLALKEVNPQDVHEGISDVDLAFEDGFEIGCSYLITLKLFGYSVIEVSVQLVPWNYGGDIFVPDFDKPD